MAAPNVKTVLSGSVTYASGDGTAPTAISLGATIVTANSTVTLTTRDSDTDGRELRHTWAYTLTTTTIAFTRNSSAFASSVTIEWEVTEFDAGVNVQRGVVEFDTTSETVNITEVIGSSSIIRNSGMETSANAGKELFQALRKFSTNVSGDDQLTFSRGTAPATGESTQSWEVVEFDQDVTLQRGTVTRTSSGTTSVTVSSVDTTTTTVNVEGLDLRSTFTPWARNNYAVELTTSTNINVTNVYDGSATTTIFDWLILEFTGGQTVESGSVAFGPSDTLKQPTFTSMTTPSTGFLQVMEMFTPDTTGDVSSISPGERHLAFSLNGSTGVDIQRNLSDDNWTAQWSAIDWDIGGGGPTGRIMGGLANLGGLAGFGGIAGPGGGLAG